MPFQYGCTDHPDFLGESLQDGIRHVDLAHPDSDYMHLRDAKVLTIKFEPQVTAQGNVAQHVGGCSMCGNIGPIDEAGHCQRDARALMLAGGGRAEG